jgi:hypothetical protein
MMGKTQLPNRLMEDRVTRLSRFEGAPLVPPLTEDIPAILCTIVEQIGLWERYNSK